MRESGAQIACRWGWGGDFCRWIPLSHFPGTIDLPAARCSGRPLHAGSIPPTAVVDWLSVNLPPSPCLHLTILESGILSGTTLYYHALPQTLIVWQRLSLLTSRRLFLRLLSLDFFDRLRNGPPYGGPFLFSAEKYFLLGVCKRTPKPPVSP